MVMYMRIPEAVAKLRMALDGETGPLHGIERRQLDCDYAQVGGALLRRWKLSEGICLPIEQQTEPHAEQERAVESALLNIVAGVVEAQGRGGDPFAFCAAAAWQITGLARPQVEAALAESAESIEGLAGFLNGQLAA
jgi:HD-like signal output (HDOD) protein